MLCPEMSGIGFPSCVLGSCVFYECWVVSGDGAKTFFAFIFLVDLKHGAICQTILECTLTTIFELWVNVLILYTVAQTCLEIIKLISVVYLKGVDFVLPLCFGVSDNL